MDKKIQKAKELFRALEEGRPGRAAETAMRSFLVQQRLLEVRS